MTKTIEGTVTKKSNPTTATVSVSTSKRHPLYRKNYKVNKTYQVHDAEATTKVGDQISFTDCKPVSKSKKWKVVNLKKEKGV